MVARVPHVRLEQQRQPVPLLPVEGAGVGVVLGAAVVARLRAGGTAVVVGDRAPAAREEPVDVTDSASVHALAERVGLAVDGGHSPH
ncbi:hypothetical protein [Streptomyces sp. OE57]|uniref:hypothetical protein n=1 Tax=Streptomyces lacaronensis TaxID=3379885 RepID=UPI0039B74937